MKYNKHRKYIIGTLLAVLLSVSMSSCDDFLSVDDHFSDMTQLDSVFLRKELVQEYIRGAASYLPNEGNLWTSAPNPFQGASDENFNSWDDDRHIAVKFLRDEITPFDSYYLNYSNYYQGIRMSNIVLKRINEVTDISDIDRRDFMGRCYFLRGYYIFMLLLQYGPVPLPPDDPFSMDASVETMALERATYDECVTYICDNMEKAREYLPEKREVSADMHVPDEAVPLAVMSRLRLYAASPWYNGNRFYADWTRQSDGAHFINQAEDKDKWGKAAVAAKRFLEYNKEKQNRFSLYTTRREPTTPDLPANVSADNFPNGAGDIDPYRSYSSLFNGEVPRLLNPEVIYSVTPRRAGDSPMWTATPYGLGGGNGLNLTQDVVDAFYMVDGRDINDSSAEYPYPVNDAHETIGKDILFSGYTLRGTAARMYANREIRFYATMGFSECFWPGTSYTGSDNTLKNVTVTYYADGNAAVSASHHSNYNHTGYTCKKYIHPEDNLKASASVREKTFPVFRFAEILLNYAEALNELDGSYRDEETGITVSRDQNEILSAFNQIRYRAGLPGLTSLPDQHTMRNLIKRERQIEFACEAKRYHDLRRWGEAKEAYNKPVRGMNIKARSTDRKNFYTPIILSNDRLAYRSFSEKQYFCPIPKSAMNKNPKLIQNPGW